MLERYQKLWGRRVDLQWESITQALPKPMHTHFKSLVNSRPSAPRNVKRHSGLTSASTINPENDKQLSYLP